MLKNILWWAYSSSIYTLREEMDSRLAYHSENFLRNIQSGKKKKDVAIDLNKVDDAIKSGIRWLENFQRGYGWIGGRFWEVWNTANALLALTSTDVESNATKPAVDFLLQCQLDNGGFFLEGFPASREDIKYRRDIYCTETVAVALMGIYKYEGKITPEIRAGLDFIIRGQRECGGWDLSYLGDPKIVNVKMNYFPSVTGYSLVAILLIDENPPKKMLEKALAFLKKAQHKNGSFGRSYSYYNTEAYALRNIVSALESIKKMSWPKDVKLDIKKMIGLSISYTKKMQNYDGSWSARSISSKALCTSLFLQTLLAANENDNDKNSINLAVDWLLKNQKDRGFWKGGYYGHLLHPYLGYITEISNDVLATSEAIVSLNEYKKSLKIT